MATIGKAIKIKGDIEGREDTVIEGRVEGRVVFNDHHLTIGANGDILGEVTAKRVTVVGTILGNVVATDRIDVQNSGVIEGELSAPNLLVVEGAAINGTITMAERPTPVPAKELQVGPGPARAPGAPSPL